MVAVGGRIPLGYYKDPEKTAETFKVVDGVRYSIPGDYATVDEDGTIRLLGRGSATVNTGGEKVYPEEVELTLRKNKAVFDCVVVGIPDARFGETVVALVQVTDGYYTDEVELKAFCKSRGLANYKVPRRILLHRHAAAGPQRQGRLQAPARDGRRPAQRHRRLTVADHFVIDGSNLATEGRTEPSLAQLKEAVAAFHTEHPGAVATVVVDASFEHRIDPSERAAFAKTESAGEVVSPPAGAVGRGDGFLLQIADRTGGTVISNDSFQEFHAEYEWLFEPGRLIGAQAGARRGVDLLAAPAGARDREPQDGAEGEAGGQGREEGAEGDRGGDRERAAARRAEAPAPARRSGPELGGQGRRQQGRARSRERARVVPPVRDRPPARHRGRRAPSRRSRRTARS